MKLLKKKHSLKYYKIVIMASVYVIKENADGDRWGKSTRGNAADWFKIEPDYLHQGKKIPMTKKEAFLEVL